MVLTYFILAEHVGSTNVSLTHCLQCILLTCVAYSVEYLLSELVLHITSFLCICVSGISELQQCVCPEDACSQKQLGSQLKEEPRKNWFPYIIYAPHSGSLFYFVLGRWVCIQWRRIRACVSGWSLRWMSQRTEPSPSSQISAVDKSGTNITRKTKLESIQHSVSQWLYIVYVCVLLCFSLCELLIRVDEDDFIYRVVTPSVGDKGKAQDFILLASRRPPCDSGWGC